MQPDVEGDQSSSQPPLAAYTVAVVGLGLMGGSLAAALRGRDDATRRCARVIGVVRRAATVQAAEQAAFCDEVTTDLASGVGEADIVVLALPVQAILALIPRLGPLLKPGALVVDLGSSKGLISAALGTLPATVTAVGGHPMCGKERGGLAAADPALFQGARFVLTPTQRTTSAALAQATALVQAVGAVPCIVAAERHDAAVAAISHGPYLLAVAAVQVAAMQAAADPLVWELAASGFRDTTRVAASEVPVMGDTLLTNRAAVIDHLDQVMVTLADLRELLDCGDEAALAAYLTDIQQIRRGLF